MGLLLRGFVLPCPLCGASERCELGRHDWVFRD